MKKSPICNNFNAQNRHFIKINRIIESCKTLDHVQQADGCVIIFTSMFDYNLSGVKYLTKKLIKKSHEIIDSNE